MTTTTTCPMCGADAVYETVVKEDAQISHDGTVYDVSADVPARVCDACKEHFIDHHADRLIRAALRDKLGLLHPEEIRSLRRSFGLTQKDVEDATGIAAETICRLERFHVIQSRSTDSLLKLYFADLARRDPLHGTTIVVTADYTFDVPMRWWEIDVMPPVPTDPATTVANTQYALAA